MNVRVNRNGSVDCRAILALPLSAQCAWGQLRDFHRYARQDFFHADIDTEGVIPRAGSKLTLCHRYLGIRIYRVGRILIWREGVGYSFSDLSTAGPRAGFPHTFSYRIEPTSDKAWRLHIRVRGRWTANVVPRLLRKLWLAWVFGHVVQMVSNELLMYQIWRKRRSSDQKR
jgi:hypothetical protein